MQASNALARLHIPLPIVQAPMAGVSTPEMAAAVSNAGALGSVALGAGAPAQARALIAATRALTDKPFNVNLFCHRPAVADPVREAAWLALLRPRFEEFGATPPTGLTEIYKSFTVDREMLDMLLAERPAVVSFHFGLPPQAWIDALHGEGIVLAACATSLEEAAQIEAAGIDWIVAQGYEAGGHRGVFDPEQGDPQIGTFALVRAIARRSKLPVIAAGGIMDGQGIAAALQLGASAVQMGTAFLLCPESSANAAYRTALKSAPRTAVTATLSGRAARGIPNRLYLDADAQALATLPDYPIAYDAAKALTAAAVAKGNSDFAAQWAGQGVSMVRELPAGELIAVLAEEWRAAGR
ncbi:NAD(P)H-dependent flavin oxidoreductase [Variovorax sp. LT1R16]|uniref:NAD(P)H-dependent flavin oxidoreductase n=1 Tax=Variovorax sp. LT1R16 TaxID=3443728 RepID=UPI003F44F2DF